MVTHSATVCAVRRLSASVEYEVLQQVQELARLQHRSVASMAGLMVLAGLEAEFGWSPLDGRMRSKDLGPVRLSAPAEHSFAPQRQNALKCSECGGKKADHR